ncbi:MAG: cysteine hydrolase [Erysipelotrichia bacterium]|nr:cysteine hydrolase [Erysipelotrichia bacterium]
MRKLLIVVDYQNDFIEGALGFAEAEGIAPAIIALIEDFKRSGDDVVFTMDTHQSDYLKTTEGHYLPVEHCIKGEKGWELHPSIKSLVGDHLVMEKPGFGSAELGHYLEKNHYDEIYLCGLVSDICVFTNALIAKTFAGVHTKVKVVRVATLSSDLAIQEKSFEMLKHLHVEII